MGFDICEMPWHAANFDDEKRFVLACIDSTQRKVGWDRLSYVPRAEWVIESLLQFERLITELAAAHLPWQPEIQDDVMLEAHAKCPIHGVYLHEHGCIVCND